MGFFDILLKKNKRAGKKVEIESSELKKELSNRYEHQNGDRKMVLLENTAISEPKIYSPAVEHPLLTIQDRISKLEEIYKSLNGKLTLLDDKVATKEDMDVIKAMIHEDLAQGDQVIGDLENINSRLDELRKIRVQLTRQVDQTKDELTRKVEVIDQIDKQIDLMECDQNILDSLGKGDKSTITLAKELDLTRQYIWGRLKELQAARYVSSIKKGRKTSYTLLKR